MIESTVRAQDEAQALLQAALSSGHVGHAYLFHGPSGVGKTKAALLFARTLLCETPLPGPRACETCGSCRAVAALRHPDLEVMVPLPTFRTEGRTERQADEARSEARAQVLSRMASEPFFVPVFSRPPVHSIEDLARAKQFLSLTPQRDDGWKILIVKGAEAITGPGAHAFLKILEEPQPRRLLILGTRQVRALLPTIASRCLHVRFRPLDQGLIAEALRARGVSKGVSTLLAATSQGSLGRALSLMEPPLDATTRESPGESEFSKVRATALELFVNPRTHSVLGPLRRARIERDRGRFLTAVALAVHYYRDVLRRKVLGERTPLAHSDLEREISAHARELSLSALVLRVRVLEEIAAAVRSNVTAAYAVASAQLRMGLGPGAPASGTWPRAEGVRR
jgi:DNA polymerase III delta prime subunit